MWKPLERVKYEPNPGLWPTVTEACNSLLFSPVKLGSITLEQRTWVPAMVPWRATEDGFVARVIAASEQLSSIYTDDSLLLARACYHLGNRHVELQITQKSVHYRHDHVLDKMLKSFGLNVISESLPFQPEKGAYNSHSTGHGHHQEH